MCNWAMRSLLIEDEDRLMLLDCGIGDKQSEKFFGYYYLHGNDSLDKSLDKHGFGRNDITDVFLTHLHFDHCGGAIVKENDLLVPSFKKAKFWSNDRHWDWATKPNPREKASFLSENILPIQESGHINGKTVVFMADLLPSTAHLPLPYVMGYDTRPLLTMSEKEKFLNAAADNNYILFLEHDAMYECCTVKHTERGVRLDQAGNLADFI